MKLFQHLFRPNLLSALTSGQADGMAQTRIWLARPYLFLMILGAFSIPGRGAGLDGTFTVTENYTITMEYRDWGSGRYTGTQNFPGSQSATFVIRNGAYNLVDRTGLPDVVSALDRPLARTISGVDNSIQGENLCVRPVQTSQIYGIAYLSFFIVSVPVAPDELPGIVTRYNQFTTQGLDLTSLRGSGSITFGAPGLTITITSTSSLIGAPTPPAIRTQPAPTAVAVGNPVTFSVAANGAMPLLYQWRRNGVNLTDGGKIAGSKTASLSLSNVTTNEAGNYDVVISNSLGSVTSAAATLTVNRLAQTITFPPLEPRRLGDPPFGLTATTSSGLPLTYTSSAPAVASVVGSTVTILGNGSTTITASQPGNATYLPAASVSQSLLVTINQRPLVELFIEPRTSLVVTGSVVTMTAVATDPDGSVQSLRIKNGTSLLTSFDAPPFSLTWSNIPLGSHLLTAEVTDNFGLSSTSAPVSLNAISRPEFYYAALDPDSRFRVGANARSGISHVLESSDDLILWSPQETNSPQRGIFSTFLQKTNRYRFFRLLAR